MLAAGTLFGAAGKVYIPTSFGCRKVFLLCSVTLLVGLILQIIGYGGSVVFIVGRIFECHSLGLFSVYVSNPHRSYSGHV